MLLVKQFSSAHIDQSDAREIQSHATNIFKGQSAQEDRCGRLATLAQREQEVFDSLGSLPSERSILDLDCKQATCASRDGRIASQLWEDLNIVQFHRPCMG